MQLAERGCSSLMVVGNFWARIQKYGGLDDGVTCTHSANCAADRRDSPGAILDRVDMSVVVQRQVRSLGCQGRRHPVVTQAILMVSTVLNTIEILQLQFIDCGRLLFTCPSLCNDKCRMVQTFRKLCKVLQLQYI